MKYLLVLLVVLLSIPSLVSLVVLVILLTVLGEVVLTRTAPSTTRTDMGTGNTSSSTREGTSA